MWHSGVLLRTSSESALSQNPCRRYTRSHLASPPAPSFSLLPLPGPFVRAQLHQNQRTPPSIFRLSHHRQDQARRRCHDVASRFYCQPQHAKQADVQWHEARRRRSTHRNTADCPRWYVRKVGSPGVRIQPKSSPHSCLQMWTRL